MILGSYSKILALLSDATSHFSSAEQRHEEMNEILNMAIEKDTNGYVHTRDSLEEKIINFFKNWEYRKES